MKTRQHPAGYLRRHVDSLALYRAVRRCLLQKYPDFALLPLWRQRRIRGGIISSLVQGLHGNAAWGFRMLQKQRAGKRWHPERRRKATPSLPGRTHTSSASSRSNTRGLYA